MAGIDINLWVFPKMRGTFLGGPYKKDYRIFFLFKPFLFLLSVHKLRFGNLSLLLNCVTQCINQDVEARVSF